MLQAAESDAIWQGKRSADRIRMGWSHFDPAGLSSLLVQRGRNQRPSIDVEFVRLNSEQNAAVLERDVVDMLFSATCVQGHNIDSQYLCTDRLVAVVSSGSRLAGHSTLRPQDFQDKRLLTYGLHPEPGWEYDRFFARGACFPTDVTRIESTDLICWHVAHHHGISILPSLCVNFSAWASKLKTIELAIDPIRFDWQASFVRGNTPANALLARLLDDIVDPLQAACVARH